MIRSRIFRIRHPEVSVYFRGENALARALFMRWYIPGVIEAWEPRDGSGCGGRWVLVRAEARS